MRPEASPPLTLRRAVRSTLVVLGVAFAAFTFYVDRVVSSAIEKGATYAFGVETRVGLARLSLLTGSLRTGSVRVANPPGFASPHFLEFGSGRLDVSLASLREPVVRVARIHVADVDVVLEKSGGRSNTDVILGNMKRFESRGPQEPERRGSGRKLIVDEIVITDVVAHVEWSESLGKLGNVDVAVPEIRLRKIGSGRGVSTAELANIVTKAVLSGIARQGTNLPSALRGPLVAELGSLTRVPMDVIGATGESLGSSLDKVPGARRAVEGAGKAGRVVTEKAGRALRGLLGRDEKE
jgi:hypothetical protein